jgi:hypothetical protein
MIAGGNTRYELAQKAGAYVLAEKDVRRDQTN